MNKLEKFFTILAVNPGENSDLLLFWIMTSRRQKITHLTQRHNNQCKFINPRSHLTSMSLRIQISSASGLLFSPGGGGGALFCAL